MLIKTNLYIIRSYIETICRIRKHVFYLSLKQTGSNYSCCLQRQIILLHEAKLSCIVKEVKYNWKQKNSSYIWKQVYDANN
jgi:hypothetical protein